MEFDLTKPYCFYFSELAKIPHGSLNEKAVSDYIVAFAQSHNLRYKQDELENVIIYKAASSGYEEAEPLMIQAHIDMVCEKNADYEHDFLTDPLVLYSENGFLKAQGTTLGADDGSGVAMMLAVLAAADLAHPPLECVFTSQEEIGLIGALALKAEDFQARRLISLDGGGEVSTMLSAAGGCMTSIKIPLTRVSNEKPTYRLAIRGLLGGHSGMEINKERGNANKLMARLLVEAKSQGCDITLVSFDGGLKDNAIPRECEAIFVSSSQEEQLAQQFTNSAGGILGELKWSDADFRIEFEKTTISGICLDAAVSEKICNFVYLAPNGFKARSLAIAGLTLTSLNLGVTKTEKACFIANFAIRSAVESAIDDLALQLRVLAGYAEAEVSVSARYPGWDYNPKSPLRDKLAAAVKAVSGEELELEAAHGGSECGVFSRLLPGVDIILIGPKADDVHTPQERMDLASFDRTYQILCHVLAACK